MEDLRKQRNMMESIHRQKSRELWLKSGDQNSKFFHLKTIIQCRKNIINLIKDGERWIQKEHKIANYFKENFETLFSSNHSRRDLELENLFGERISKEDNFMLSVRPTEMEIKETVWSLHPLKSPIPDGFLGIFYRNY